MAFANSNKSTSKVSLMFLKSPLTFGLLVLPLLILACSRNHFIDGNDWRMLLPSALFRRVSDHPANSTTQFEIMKQQYAAQCPEQPFSPHIFSIDPIIIYLENYMSYAETRYLKELGRGRYALSAFAVGNDPEKKFNTSIRSSTSAILPEDPVVACLEQRTLNFQGFLPESHIENLQTVKYEINDLFRPHYDWSSSDTNPRLSTIFGYVECDDCQGGSTQFPNIDWDFPSSWCKFVDCESEDAIASSGVGFKPIVGNAVFWVHYYSNGTGHPDTLHAGMPLRSGTKIGLNIMTRRDSGYSI